MKKIINGKRYDTTTAKFLGSESYSNISDFNYWEEELYLKKTGEFFIYGKGGPMSPYSKPCGQNNYTGGSAITPLLRSEAQEWVENYLDADDYEKIFGEIEENRVQISCWISEEMKNLYDEEKKDTGITLTEIFEMGIINLWGDKTNE